MSEPRLVRDLFAIPEQVRTSDFVSVLTRDVDAPERTAESYVPTPALVDAFDRALDLVGHAMQKGETRGAVLHGSFGSGKSHFMAMLSLMIQGHEAPWRLPELHPVRTKHGWVAELAQGKRRVLELHIHMLGKDSLEQAIFDAYLAATRAKHPGEPLPALFADEALFENAKALRTSLGDEKFFGAIDAAVGAASSGLKKRRQWSAEKFDAAIVSTDPDERRRLFDALVRSHFPAFTASGGHYLPFAQGLANLTAHAKDLGYDALVLFLDELILWLATEKIRAVNEETPKIGILGEHDGAVPIVSFLAQQRGLDEMVGDQLRGEEQARLKQLLHFWEDRFDHLQFENKNLPAVIEKRLLRPKDDAAKAALDAAFATMQRRAGRAYATLVAGEDSDAFRKLYPFSPALVETLVDLSAALSRSRTAIKLLAELLVDHIPDLALGDLVLLGDVFDVLHDDLADGMIRHRLRDAKKLYRQALPILQDKHGTKSPERCQRLRDDAEHRRSLGCSGCAERDCRADNRLFKTLLLAALVPGVETLRDLTVSRLVELNHGSLRVALAGTEASKALATLRSWEGRLPELRLGEEKDPRVSVELGGIDVVPILQQAYAVDNPGQHKELLRALLLRELEIDGGEQPLSFHFVRRSGRVRFGNVRTMGEEQLLCEEGDEWQLLIDYPFDDAGHGPAEDEQKLEAFREAGRSAWTLVWLPSFLSEENERSLHELVRLEEILRSSENKQRYLGHLGHDKRAEAERTLEARKSSKERSLVRALEAAYGVRAGGEGDLDPTRRVEQHLWLLAPAPFTPRTATSLKDAYDKHVRALLAARYPAHPQLGGSLTSAKVDELAALFDDAAASPDKQVRVSEKTLLQKAREVLEPLGVAQVREDTVHVNADTRLRAVEQTRAQKNLAEPTVREVIEWADPDGSRGLRTPSAELLAALFVRAYASWQGRTLLRGGERYDPQGKKALAPEVRLAQPEMPTPKEWEQARKMASAVFGVAASQKVGHRADNVQWLASEVRRIVERQRADCAAIPSKLAQRLASFGLEGGDRLTTARSADALCAALTARSPVEQVRALASFRAETSGTAVGASLAGAAEVKGALEDDLLFGYFEPLDPARPDAAEVLEELKKALRQDESHVRLAERLRELARSAQSILRPPILRSPISGSPISGSPISGSPISGAPISGAPISGAQGAPSPAQQVSPPGSGPSRPIFAARLRATGREEIERALDELALRAKAALVDDGGELVLVLEASLTRKDEA